MHVIVGQILAGTRIDFQGERNTRDFLERYAAAYAGRRLPLNQHHNLSLPVVGYAENLRIVPDGVNTGEWSLVADVTLTTGENMPSGGFSFSYIEKLRPSQLRERFEVFLPYPHYNDTKLMDQVFEEGYVSVGKIVRKNASPETIALVVGVAVAVIQPLWEDVYRTKIAPAVIEFFQTRFTKLERRNISCDFMQHIDYAGNIAQVLFMPLRGRDVECLQPSRLLAGMLLAADYLNALEINHVPATKIVLRFEQQVSAYEISSIHFADGSVRTGT